MNIENLIAEANPVPLARVADGNSLHAQRTLTQIMAPEHGERAARHRGPSRASRG
jgi:hypothetical protein